jgi:hypothetical protein
MSERGGGLPGAPQQAPGLPSNFLPIEITGFSGLNTKQKRAAIKDTELSWCDGWMPVAPNTLQILPGTGPILYTSGTPGDIVWFGFGNIAATPYCFALHTDGSLTAINLQTTDSTTIMASGTITGPRSIFGFSQWSSLYDLFCNDQSNGYWIWDGSNLYASGTASPVTTITDGGAGYTSVPGVNTFGGSGSGIDLVAQIENGAVSLVTVTNPGSGYQVGDNVIMVFAGGNGTNTAYGQAVISNGVITSVFLQSGGSGYQSGTGVQTPPTVIIIDGTGLGASIIVNGMAGGIVTGLQVVSGGSNYSAPVLSFTGGSGSGAMALAFVDDGVITGYSPIAAGLGYQSTPTVSFLGSTGAGATAQATINGTGQVSAVQIQTGGKGYTNPTYVTFTGGNGPATGTIEIMPFGVSGTTLEVYQGHVWVGNGAARSPFPPLGRVIFSAGGDPADFGDDGGAFVDTNSFARVGYHSLKQTNGFLYMIADCSLDYISGVTTTSTSTTATTTFNNQNADPQIGSPWPSSITVYSRNIMFGNPIGIHASQGGAVAKVSGPLDGIYFSAASQIMPDSSSAVATIFGITVYMMLFPVIDSITGETVNKLLMWDGNSPTKPWFTSQQDRALTYISTFEGNSVLQAWGTDGTNIFPLFDSPSTGFTKTFQSKLYSNPAYWMTKTANELFGVIQNASAPLTITVDNELGVGSGGGSVSVLASADEFNVFGPVPCGQNGSLLGLTVSTTAAAATIMSLTVIGQEEVTRL